MTNHPARQTEFVKAYLDMEVEAGNVVANQHPSLPLIQYTYSKECVFQRNWNFTTEMARGLILNSASGHVVATPFPKFFNLGERTDTVPNEPFEVFEKLDGSLIILFNYLGQWYCATKGSFISEQANWANEWIKPFLSKMEQVLHPGYTYLCEAIYPANKIVIPYNYSALVLLAAYDRGGNELTYNEMEYIATNLHWPLAQRFAFDKVSDLVAHAKELPPDVEGWVLRFRSGYRLKIKGEAYLRMHRAISKLTPLTVWESMMNGEANMLRKELPEEFWPDFDQILSLLEKQLGAIVSDVTREAAVRVTWIDKEVGLDLPNMPDHVRHLIFPFRKDNGFEGRARKTLFNFIRPDRNHLPGYVPSSSIQKVQDE